MYNYQDTFQKVLEIFGLLFGMYIVLFVIFYVFVMNKRELNIPLLIFLLITTLFITFKILYDNYFNDSIKKMFHIDIKHNFNIFPNDKKNGFMRVS